MKTFNIPNILSFFRMGAAFLFLALALDGDWNNAFLVFCVAAATDMIDGTIARVLGQRTQLGAFLDPMADKLLMFFGFLALTMAHTIPWPVTLLVVARDLLIIWGVFFLKRKRGNLIYRPTYLSKLTTLFQIIAVFSALLLAKGVGGFFLREFNLIIWITALLTLVTGFQYFRIGWRLLHSKK